MGLCAVIYKAMMEFEHSLNQLIIHPNRYTFITAPDCFLPKDESELNKLIIKLQKNPLWVFPNNPKYANLPKGVIAYRLKITDDINLFSKNGSVGVDSEKKYPLISYRIYLNRFKQKKPEDLWPGWAFVTSTNSCDAKRYEMRVHIDFESCDYSHLIIENGFVCLSLEELGFDLDGKFAKDVINEISGEFKQYAVLK